LGLDLASAEGNRLDLRDILHLLPLPPHSLPRSLLLLPLLLLPLLLLPLLLPPLPALLTADQGGLVWVPSLSFEKREHEHWIVVHLITDVNLP
jgi:hypothetical protein